MSIKTIAVFASLLALAGCASLNPPLAAAGTPERACQEAADANPALRNFASTMAPNANPNSFYEDYLAKRKQLVDDCLAVRTGRPRGGVQKVL